MTWNVGTAAPPTSLAPLMAGLTDAPDIVVIGCVCVCASVAEHYLIYSIYIYIYTALLTSSPTSLQETQMSAQALLLENPTLFRKWHKGLTSAVTAIGDYMPVCASFIDSTYT